MRIIAGNFKGKKLLTPNDKFTRPLRDVVKESIFNILQHSKILKINLINSNVLDLFSGVGTFGLECLSRNSKHVTLKMLKKNIKNLNCSTKSKIVERDIFSLNKLNLVLENYELIFLDPPFKELRIRILLNIIKSKKILKKNGVILIHRESKTLDELPDNFTVLFTKKYGRSKILFGKFD